MAHADANQPLAARDAVLGGRLDADRAASEAFYRAVVGWEFEAPDPSMGGMMGAAGGSHWLVYVAVTAAAFDSPYGRMAGATDPAGAAFMLAAPTRPAPDR